MKKLVLLMVGVFTITSLVGCSKKKSEEGAMDNMTNGVVSENVVSLNEVGAMSGGAVPVVVDNAEAIPLSNGEMNAAVSAVTDKPTPNQIQQALKNAGFYKGKVDGNIGPKTKRAIEDFQAQNGLKADGKVGPKTWKALSAHLGQTTEIVNPTADVAYSGQ